MEAASHMQNGNCQWELVSNRSFPSPSVSLVDGSRRCTHGIKGEGKAQKVEYYQSTLLVFTSLKRLQWNLSPFLINRSFTLNNKCKINTFSCFTWLFLFFFFFYYYSNPVSKPATTHRVKDVKSQHGAIKLILK